jgi:hypothetical protein
MGIMVTGARAIFRINGNKVAYAQSVNYSETISNENVDVLDKYSSEEIAETGVTVEFSCTSFITETSTIKELGIMPKFDQLMTVGVMTAEIIDHKTDKVLLFVTGVKCVGRSGTVDARNVMTETWNFKGLKEEG